MFQEREQFADFLRQQGLRLTSERVALCEEIYRQRGHLEAEALLAAVRARGHQVSRATVYRTLDLLVRSGLVRKQRVGARGQLFEPVHPGRPHDHLVCSDCGALVEFVSTELAHLQGEICRAHGFSGEHHQLQILGLCNDCRGAREAATTVALAEQPQAPA
jgi:Fur family ferric uptake transcriptional regulator